MGKREKWKAQLEGLNKINEWYALNRRGYRKQAKYFHITCNFIFLNSIFLQLLNLLSNLTLVK